MVISLLGRIHTRSSTNGDIITGWWFGTCFPYIGNNHPNWHSYLSEGVETTNQISDILWGYVWIISWLIDWKSSSIAWDSYRVRRRNLRMCFMNHERTWKYAYRIIDTWLYLCRYTALCLHMQIYSDIYLCMLLYLFVQWLTYTFIYIDLFS